MKSFGVRLAVGAITILFGAYAAALAQKDKQNQTESWTADASTLSEPAVPIEGKGNEEWISKPDSYVAGRSSSLALATFDPPDDDPSSVNRSFGAERQESGAEHSPDGAVTLVQHTQPVDAPAEIGDLPAFPQPSSDGPATAAVAEFAPDWALPSAPESADSLGPSPSDTMTLPSTPNATFSEPAAAPASTLPQFQLGTPPINEGVANASPGAPESRTSQSVSPSTSPVPSPGSPPQPEPNLAQAADGNLLRADDAGINLLRDVTAPPAFEPNATAQSNGPMGGQSPSLGQSQFPGRDFRSSNPAPGAGQALTGQPQAGRQIAPTGGFDPPQLPAPGQFSQQPTPNSQAPYGAQPQRSRGQLQLAPTQQFGQQPPDRYANNSQRYEPRRFDESQSALAIDPTKTTDAPGDRRLEGVQSPSVIIHKRAPSEVQVGKPATFVIQVQNVGSVEALDVQVHDMVPSGMRLVDASPVPMAAGTNALVWQLGTMPAGDERTVTMQLIPEAEGELGSVARVSFEAAASVRTMSTRPELRVIQHAPETVLIGQQLEIELEISNPGSGTATNVVVQEDVPEGLEHPKGARLDNAIGDLAPGEVRRQVLRLRAVAPGIIQNTIRLAGDDDLVTDHTVAVQVVAPQIEVELAGPSKRFLERQAFYDVKIGNVGTADATNVELAVQLDRGFTFVSTENEGQYDPSRHTVYWSLARLPAGGTGSVGLTLLPVEEGEQAIKIDARADLGVVAKNERRLSVEGFAELSFSITNPGGPIELGAETEYEIRVNNSGSKADTNVQVQLQLPPGLQLLSSDAEAMSNPQGLVAFDPKPQLSPGTDVVYRVRVQGVAPGTHIVRAVVASDQAQTPVTKEESTLVYADQ